MKRNRNYLDRIEATVLIAAATCKNVNGEKEIPYWTGLTPREKYSKEFSAARHYQKKTEKRRELKEFVNRLTSDPEYLALIKSRIK